MSTNNDYCNDFAVSSKNIPDSCWLLVFTHLGRYFFYNRQNGERSWLPPRDILTLLKEKFSPMRREMFFDPSFDEEEDAISDVDSDFEAETESISNNISKKSDTFNKSDTSNDTHEDQFKLYLLKNQVDPFAPWPKILAMHSSSPEFLAIPSDKRRQDLFAQICPVLIDQRRSINAQKQAEAKNWWEQVKQENWRNGCPWYLVQKKIKGNQKFSALLNEKECEKEYKNKK